MPLIPEAEEVVRLQRERQSSIQAIVGLLRGQIRPGDIISSKKSVTVLSRSVNLLAVDLPGATASFTLNAKVHDPSSFYASHSTDYDGHYLEQRITLPLDPSIWNDENVHLLLEMHSDGRSRDRTLKTCSNSELRERLSELVLLIP